MSDLETILRNKSVKRLKIFLKKNYSLRKEALARACEYGKNNIVRLLFKKGDDGCVYWAIANGQVHTVKMLIELGVKMERMCLLSAVVNGHADVVELLCEKGLKPDNEMLQIAVEDERTDIISIFLNYGANLGENHNENIKKALRSGNMEMVKFLFEKGVRLN